MKKQEQNYLRDCNDISYRIKRRTFVRRVQRFFFLSYRKMKSYNFLKKVVAFFNERKYYLQSDKVVAFFNERKYYLQSNKKVAKLVNDIESELFVNFAK